MRNKDKQMTSVKLNPNVYEEFKMECVKNNFSFQKLASRAIFLYITDIEFRKKIHKTNI